MSKKMLVRDCRSFLKVGQKVRTNGNDGDVPEVFEGIIGEVRGSNFYVWHHDPSRNGGVGLISPITRGFEYSWAIAFYSTTIIEFLDDEIDKKKSKEAIKKLQEEIKRLSMEKFSNEFGNWKIGERVLFDIKTHEGIVGKIVSKNRIKTIESKFSGKFSQVNIKTLKGMRKF